MVNKCPSASELFRKKFKGRKNIMTPHFEDSGKINCKTAYELSSGSGIFSKKIWGVTVIKKTNGKIRRLHDSSELFNTKIDALDHIKNLKKRR